MKHLPLTKLTTSQLTLVWLIRTHETVLQGGDVYVSFEDGEPVFHDEWGTSWAPDPLWQIRTLKLDVQHDGKVVRVSQAGHPYTAINSDLDRAVMRVSVMLSTDGWTPATLLAVPETEDELEGLVE